MPLFDDLKAHEKEELLVSYAVLILHDDKAPISEENINKLVTAAKGTATEPFTKAFSSLLADRDVHEMLMVK